MSETVILWLLGAAGALILALVGIYVGITRQLTRIETNQEHHVKMVKTHREDHNALAEKVSGLSRHVERHETILNSLE